VNKKKEKERKKEVALVKGRRKTEEGGSREVCRDN